jgi:hypothetical protein
MKSEISFLLELVLEHKLQKATQTAIKERIKELEESPAQVFHARPQGFPIQQMAAGVAQAGVAQAQSTIAAMARHAGEDPPLPPSVAPTAPPVIPQRIVGGEVTTGANTRGPRKW